VPILVFVLRLAIGVLLIVAGAFKAHDGVAITGASIAGYRLLPSFAVIPLAVFLPYFEIAIGVYLSLGLFTRAVASVVAFQMAMFTAAVASVVVRHIQISCGCFGAAETTIASWYDVARDAALIGLCAFVAWKSPGKFSLDARLREASAAEDGSTAHE
jgi:uncharacterized membrane protein YphA (DoxX/SURF4 family)